jgi:hypothetical protein
MAVEVGDRYRNTSDDELGRDWAPVGGQQRGGGRRG